MPVIVPCRWLLRRPRVFTLWWAVAVLSATGCDGADNPGPSAPFVLPPLAPAPTNPPAPNAPPVLLASLDSIALPPLPPGVACCREVWTSGTAVYLLAAGPDAAVVLRRAGTVRDGGWQQVTIRHPVQSVRPVAGAAEPLDEGQVYWVGPDAYGIATLGRAPDVVVFPNPAAPAGILQLVPDASAARRPWAVGKDGRVLRQRAGGTLATFDTVRGARSATSVRATRAAVGDSAGRLILAGVHAEDALIVTVLAESGAVHAWDLTAFGGTPATHVDLAAGRLWIGSPTAVAAHVSGPLPYLAVRVQGTTPTVGVPHLCVQGGWLYHTDGTRTSIGAPGRSSWLQSAGVPSADQLGRIEQLRERLAGGIHCAAGGSGSAVFTVSDGYLYQLTPPS